MYSLKSYSCMTHQRFAKMKFKSPTSKDDNSALKEEKKEKTSKNN